MEVAGETVYHDAKHPSHIVLPDIPAQGKEVRMPLTRKAFLKTRARWRPPGAFPGPRAVASSRPSRPPPASRRTRIAEAEFAPFDMRLKQVFRTALGAESVEREVLVRLRTADGLIGWGGLPLLAGHVGDPGDEPGPGQGPGGFVRDRDPFTVARILAEMDATAPAIPASRPPSRWPCGTSAARSPDSLSIACSAGSGIRSRPTPR